ncbi:PREDICTED: merlin-like [Vollenhovia emeryi]|uniref:merlin-like n=1 Tax=Vollenhovia emeryi TaxID=411798 RepID=UPI0005F425E5|nr:PREDICTED: merlin-like [Vollenhovia emeryi]
MRKTIKRSSRKGKGCDGTATFAISRGNKTNEALNVYTVYLFYNCSYVLQRRSEETADLLAEKSRVAEEEAMLLSQKASEAKQEITRIRLNNMKTEEEKVHLERKTREAELLTERLVQESERRAAEAEKLKDELLRARIAEKEAKEKLLEFLSRNAYTATITPVPNLFPSTQVLPSDLQADLQTLQLDAEPLPPDLTSYDLIGDGDVD